MTDSGLTFTNCTYRAGGYVKIGNLVIVNLRVSQTQGNFIKIEGFPSYSGIYNLATVTVLDANDDTVKAPTMQSNGTIQFNVSGTDTFIIGGCYICS